MSSGSKHDPVAAEALSALVDGEVDTVLAQRVCAAWREDGSARSTWHAYQLIGDVLRSEDLASTASQDAAFLDRLRTRLAQEPVVLAPQPLESTPAAAAVRRQGLRRRRTWMASTAVAAGFVAVAGVVVVLRAPSGDGAAAVLASREASPSGAPAATVAAATAPQALAETVVADPEMQALDRKMLRDSRLDRYLAAHKQFAGSSALGVPSQFLRSATVDASGR